MFWRLFLYKLATDKYRGPVAGAVKFFLFILSLIYGLVVRLFIFFYRFSLYRLNCKVISVGNITLGGTGKTSLVELIAKCLRQKGRKVAILSRGYKRKVTSYETMGDEPYMLQKRLIDVPVLADANRIRAAKTAICDYGADTVILDDGFQQWRIKKDLEILTIDSTKPFGNRHMIPRGILRQPLSSLKRADIFVLTKTNLIADTQDIKSFLNQINPSALIAESIHQPIGFYKIDKPNELLNTDIFQGKSVTLFSGIGDPDSFESLIRNLGIEIGLSLRFADHHNYSQKDLDNIVSRSKTKQTEAIITTEKDAARLSQLSVVSCRLSVLVLRIELRIIREEEKFYSRLLRLYNL